MSNNSHNTAQLAALIEQKLVCLTQVRDLGERQLELIAHGEMSVLMRVLSAKQRLLDDLTRLERALDPFRTQSPDERVWANNAERERCVQSSAKCRQLFAEIVDQERSSESQLIVQRDDAEQRLRGMHVAAQAHGAYAYESSGISGHLDLTTES